MFRRIAAALVAASLTTPAWAADHQKLEIYGSLLQGTYVCQHPEWLQRPFAARFIANLRADGPVSWAEGGADMTKGADSVDKAVKAKGKAFVCKMFDDQTNRDGHAPETSAEKQAAAEQAAKEDALREKARAMEEANAKQARKERAEKNAKIEAEYAKREDAAKAEQARQIQADLNARAIRVKAEKAKYDANLLAKHAEEAKRTPTAYLRDNCKMVGKYPQYQAYCDELARRH